MSARTQSLPWALPLLFCGMTVISACGSSSDAASGVAGTSAVAGAANGGSPSAGASGSSVGGAATAGAAAAAGVGGTSSAGGSAGGSAGVGTAGASGGGSGASGASGSAAGGGAGTSGFTLTSPAWTTQADCGPDNKPACGVFPKDNIGTSLGGSNKSPELDWTAGPGTTQSYAIVLHDLTNITAGKPFVHWVMWNIPAATRLLPAGLETGAMPSVPPGSSQRAYTGNGYQGSGKCGNVYEFVLYALPMATFTPSGTTQTSVADGLDATAAPTATLRARSGAPGCTE